MQRIIALVCFSLWTTAAIAEPIAARIRLDLELSDGSRIFAEPTEAKPVIRLRSKVGEVDVPLAEIARFEVRSDGEMLVVHWSNGDRLSGPAATEGLGVRTVLGRLHVPLAAIRRCTVQVISAALPLKPLSASASSAWDQKPVAHAIDGTTDTGWSSADYGGWYEVDLGSDYAIASISFHLQFSPIGHAEHLVYVSDKPMQGDASKGKLLKQFGGTRKDDEVLRVDCEPGTAGRFVQIRCTRSASWFNIKELVVKPGAPSR